MSGVTGAERIRSRQDYQQFLASYKNLISKFPGFVSMATSGSYNSDVTKSTFGDIDIILQISSDKTKSEVKKDLQDFLDSYASNIIVPFTSEKHTGKRTYNAGELVSVRYHDIQLGYSVQIDNIVSLSNAETTFKKKFLDLPAEKQGLILGLVKIATLETEPSILFKKLGIDMPNLSNANEEYEFNLSSVELQLRKVTYEPGTYNQIDKDVVWRSCNFDDLVTILYQYDLGNSFEDLLQSSKATITNNRSGARIIGIFSSMITVKSGEVGTAKGLSKEKSLMEIKRTFANQPSTVVFTFGRFQPPTVGHKLLIDTIKEIADNSDADYAIYVSKTQDSKSNPLSIAQKMHYLDLLFPDTHFVAADSNVRTFMEAAKELNKTYKNLIMVAGSDRVQAFENTLNQYNGIEYNYDSIQVISAGDRDPDSDSTEGISATKLRKAAVEHDTESFLKGLPGNTSRADAVSLMIDIQKGLTSNELKRNDNHRKPRARDTVA